MFFEETTAMRSQAIPHVQQFASQMASEGAQTGNSVLSAEQTGPGGSYTMFCQEATCIRLPFHGIWITPDSEATATASMPVRP